MKQVRSVLLIWFFLMMLCLAVIGNTKSSVWARSDAMGQARISYRTEMTQQGEGEVPDEDFLGGTVPITNTPELVTRDVLVPLHDELSVSHGISLTYKTKGLGDPIQTNLVVQSKAGDGTLVQIGADQWVRVASKTNGLTQLYFPGAVEVTLVSSSLPISWNGIAGVWAVNAANTGVNLVAAKQAITTELTVGKPFTNVVASTTTFTFTMRATTKFGAAWGKVYSTKLTVYNGCSSASWLQNLSSKGKFAMSVPVTAVTSYGTVAWDMRHIDGSGVILTSGTIFAPICGSPQDPPPPDVFTPSRVYLPVVLK